MATPTQANYDQVKAVLESHRALATKVHEGMRRLERVLVLTDQSSELLASQDWDDIVAAYVGPYAAAKAKIQTLASNLP